MALADYYGRAALAAAQVVAGFKPEVFQQQLDSRIVGLAIDATAAEAREGRRLADLTVRLLARLYPTIQLSVESATLRDELHGLARAINPSIAIVDSGADIGISIGLTSPRFPQTIFAGANAWNASVGLEEGIPVGNTANPFGAGAAACLAAANLFRYLFMQDSNELLDQKVTFSTWSGDASHDETGPDLHDGLEVIDPIVLVGLGAIGQAALWALANSPLRGTIHLVDPEEVELSNLQRYVGAIRSDVGRPKTSVGADILSAGSLQSSLHAVEWNDFASREGYDWPLVLTALDTAKDRRAVQASLPRWIGNAWTQPGDIGISDHGTFGSAGACLTCLYLPSGAAPNEDELIAAALKVPDRQREIRDLLYHGTPVPRDLLEAIATGLEIPIERLLSFDGATVRALYVQGLCGGALIGLAAMGNPAQDVHVPLAHQSALAGVLLGALLTRHVLKGDVSTTTITRVDVLRPLGQHLSQVAAAHDARCICRDADYVAAFKHKWPGP